MNEDDSIVASSCGLFDLFSIGIGPSSSHTVGPMRAVSHFLNTIESLSIVGIDRIEIELQGSLALTGVGHGTDQAIMYALMGEKADTIDPDSVSLHLSCEKYVTVTLPHQTQPVICDPHRDIVFNWQGQPMGHPNTLIARIYSKEPLPLLERTYHSIGGGFIECVEDRHSSSQSSNHAPHPFSSGDTLLARCHETGLNIADIIWENECAIRTPATVDDYIQLITQTMDAAIDLGCSRTGQLTGSLALQRRAKKLHDKLIQNGPLSPTSPDRMAWLNVYAMAVNEENASGKRIVTAPTNGAAGIIPAVLRYSKLAYERPVTAQHDRLFLLTCTAIGSLYKANASISGAEVGCQGEVGVACSMAAAGLCATMGGTPDQIENAAEIGMEHNLGLTCDPVAGLVQIPCIERNAMGAVKAVNAAELAIAEDSRNTVSLDTVIETMLQVGKNMSDIYKETAKGGLASTVNRPEC